MRMRQALVWMTVFMTGVGHCVPRWLALAAVLMVLGCTAWARTISSSRTVIATPLTPPSEFLWVPLLFLILFIAGCTLCLRWLWPSSRFPWFQALFRATVIGIVCGVCVHGLWSTIHMISWGALGNQVFWGKSWSDVGQDFLLFNQFVLIQVIIFTLCLIDFEPDISSEYLAPLGGTLLALVIIHLLLGVSISLPELFYVQVVLILSMVVIFGITLRKALYRFRWRILPLLGMVTVLYGITLTPYIATGALSHGRAPFQDCRDRIKDYGIVLHAYVRYHRHLPTSSDQESLARDLFYEYRENPFFTEQFIYTFTETADDPCLLFCPCADWLDRHPKSYRWNARLAGATVAELRALPKPEPLFTCPYHRHWVITTRNLLEALDIPEAYTIDISKP